MLESNKEFKKSIKSTVKYNIPDFIQVDHPVYVEFIEAYYKYLESAKIVLSGSNDYLTQETNSINFVLDENFENVLLETSTSNFINNEVIRGQTSNATATVLVQSFDTNQSLYITSNSGFIIGERIVGETSNAEATITSYFSNPVQGIQQFISLSDIDTTIFSLLDRFKDRFLEAIPNTLAEDVLKRQLVKNVKDLYSAKGTANAHKLFFRALFDETAEIIYPRERIIKLSDGQWSKDTVIRVVENGTSDFINLVGQTVYTLTPTDEIKSSIYVTNVTRFREGTTVVTELTVDIESIQGSFAVDEILYGIDPTIDLEISSTIKSIVTGVEIESGGFNYVRDDKLTFENIGNGASSGVVTDVSSGSIDEVLVLSGGQNYQINDTVIFNNLNTNGVDARGRVSIVGGSFLLEDFTFSDNISTDVSNIIAETGTGGVDDPSAVLLETNGTIILEDNPNAKIVSENENGIVSSSDVLQFENTTFSVDTNIQLDLQENQNNKILSETADEIILESETFTNLGVASESNEIRKVVLTNRGIGYTSLPTVSIQETADGRTGASLVAISNQSPGIGSVNGISMLSFGLNYDSVPTVTLPVNIFVKNVTGSINVGDSFTSVSGATGTISNYNSSLSILQVTTTATSLPVADKITTSSSATAIVHFANPASLRATIGAVATTSGRYVTDRSKISEVSNRIQDSNYYQDYSYVVKIGQSINVWRNSVKRAIHPAGWNVFGEIIISNSVSGSITRTTTTLGGFPGADFGAIIFGSVFGRRLGTIHQGAVGSPANVAGTLSDIRNESINLESGGRIVFEDQSGKLISEAILRAVTLTSDVSVKMKTARSALKRKYGTLANLPIYSFTVPRLDSSDVASNWYGLNRTKSITELNKSIVDGEYYTIQQFGNIKITDVCDVGYMKLEEGDLYDVNLYGDTGKVILEDDFTASSFLFSLTSTENYWFRFQISGGEYSNIIRWNGETILTTTDDSFFQQGYYQPNSSTKYILGTELGGTGSGYYSIKQIIFSPSNSFLKSDIFDIPDSAYATQINVPPPGEIILRKRSRTLNAATIARFSELGITFDRNTTFTFDDSV